ncbi:MAG TPA: short-chain fatty acyl-CoA regulator family protein [Vicinamibacteria bacterium]|jgi:predicted transcriptional regulator/transcriptional regulator with XRE-family HTH domain
MPDATLGPKVRALRRRESLSQIALAERLGISPSYLNLIEHNRRALSAPLLIKLAQVFRLDLHDFSPESDSRLAADLLEAFGDAVFEGADLTSAEVRELAANLPSVARAVLALYGAYRGARESESEMAARLSSDDAGSVKSWRLPSEEVSDLLQRHVNHFPELEEGAEALWREARLDGSDLYEGLVRHLERRHKVRVQVEKTGAMEGAARRYEPRSRTLALSEVLRRGSRNFQLAYQVGLLEHRAAIERVSGDPMLGSDESRALMRVALANYFAGAVLMPYGPFLEAARSERYDIEVLGNRFRTSFEQTCHRLTALRRPGAEGVPFHFVRVDVAGNISKRFSASGLRFARFSGACPRWNVFAAFLTPGMVRVQLSQMPDGRTYFWVARTLRKDSGRYHAPHTVLAIGLGCEARHARELVYADGVDLENKEAVVPVGVTCRLCERLDCEQRAFPAVMHPLRVDENARGISFYAPVGGSQG